MNIETVQTFSRTPPETVKKFVFVHRPRHGGLGYLRLRAHVLQRTSVLSSECSQMGAQGMNDCIVAIPGA